MNGSRTPVWRAVPPVIGVFAVGTVGYRVLEGASWWDAFFMTVITVTTVGYEEEVPLSRGGEVFTSILILAGLGVLLFLLTEVSRSVLEGELRQFLGRVRRSRMIERLSGHEIVCGYGRMGRAVVEELTRAGHALVVVERSAERVRALQEAGVPAIAGDAVSEAVLTEANIAHARGLVSCLNDDAHNVYTVLTARSLNPKLFVVARATEESAEQRLLRAGADRVVNPYALGGTRLAHLLVKPAIVNFFDPSVESGELQLDQTSLRRDSPVIDRSLAEADVRGRWGLSVVAVQRDAGVVPNPEADFSLRAGDVVVVFGRREQISRFESDCGQTVA